MAKGDVVFFDQYTVDVQEKIHDQENDSFKLGLVDSTLTPLATMSDPRWGAGGATNLSSNEVTPGGNYSAGGPVLANPTVSLVSGAGVFDADDVAIAQAGANPSGARWGILYNDTAPGKNAVGFVDLGSDSDLSSGPFAVNWNAAGISSIDQAA